MSGWLTGGFIYNDKGVLQALKTTEKIIDGISVEEGPDLPFNLAGHCTVHIGTIHILRNHIFRIFDPPPPPPLFKHVFSTKNNKKIGIF